MTPHRGGCNWAAPGAGPKHDRRPSRKDTAGRIVRSLGVHASRVSAGHLTSLRFLLRSPYSLKPVLDLLLGFLDMLFLDVGGDRAHRQG